MDAVRETLACLLLLVAGCTKHILVLESRPQDAATPTDAEGDGALDAGDASDDASQPSDAQPPDDAQLPGTTRLASAFEQTCALREGVTFCWGENDRKQTSIADEAFLISPRTVAGVGEAVELCTAEGHSCALQADGVVVCWGDNSRGELGTGSTAEHIGVYTIPDLRFRQVACGGSTTCAVGTDDALYCWGDNTENQVLPFDMADDTVLSPAPVAPSLAIAQVSVGQGHVCAVSTTGVLYCWGRNSNSQLGFPRSETDRVDMPRQVGTTETYLRVMAGLIHTCALRNDATLWCWGANETGQLGIQDAVGAVLPETQVALAEPVSSASTSWFHSCAIVQGGELYCWGRNVEGQLGTGTTAEVVPTPTRVGDDNDWSHVTVGRFHTCALRGGAPYCWGKNERGQLGIGDTDRRYTPSSVALP